MKKLLFIMAGLLMSFPALSQKVAVNSGVDELGGGLNNVYKVYIPHATVRMAEKKWISLMKNNKAKVKETKGIIRGDNMVIPALGSDSLQVFSKITEAEDGVNLSVAIQQRGVFMSAVTSPADHLKMEDILRTMATELGHEGIAEKTEAANDVLNSKVKEQTNLERDNEDMARSNEKMRKTIEENEKKIEENNNRKEQLKKEIESQKGVIEVIQSKKKEL